MWSAYDSRGHLVNALADELDKKDSYCCPQCRSPLRLRKGKVQRAHFAHKQVVSCILSQNEGAEHLSLKSKLYQGLSDEHEVRIEHYLPDIQQIADLLVNNHLVLEVQCSLLSLERLKQRTLAYREKGYSVRWLLGKNLWLKEKLSLLQKHLLYFSMNMGFHLWELDDEASLLRLKYLINEDIKGRVHYLQKTYPLDKEILLNLRHPYLSQPVTSYNRVMDKHIHDFIQTRLLSGNKQWLSRQEKAYLAGKNLLTQPLDDFYPQIRPPQVDGNFYQIEQDLAVFYANFLKFYQTRSDKSWQRLYPPAYYFEFYAKIKSNEKEE